MPSLQPGSQVEKYVVLGSLGSGGMASVYAVRHRVLGSRHALKLLLRADPDVTRRLIREGQVQAQLEHPNLVPVQDVLDVDGNPALLMPLVEGPSLDALLTLGPMRPEIAGPLFEGIVRGVAYAHAHGVVHRDLKPANVMLEVRHHAIVPKVADFGLATALGPEGGATRTGTFMGTPAYAAPEQLADASSVDHRADLWSLGCVLYAMLAGEGPFRGTLLELVKRIADGDYPALAERRPELDPRWSDLVDALIAVDRDARLASADALLERLAGLLDPSWHGSLSGPFLEEARSLAPHAAEESSPQSESGDETLPPPSDDLGDETVAPPRSAPSDETLPPPAPQAVQPPPAMSPPHGAPRRRLGLALAGLGVALVSGGGFYAWDQSREKTAYYASVFWESGAPVGVTPGGPELLTRYAVTTRGGRTIRVEHQTGAGTPVPWQERLRIGLDGDYLDGFHLLNDGIFPCAPVVPDGADGELGVCGARNAKQSLRPSTVAFDWGDGGVVERRWLTPEGELITRDVREDVDGWVNWRHVDRFGLPKEGLWNAPVTGERWDEDGRMVELRRRNVEGEDTVATDGVLGRLLERNAVGQATLAQELGADGPNRTSAAPVRRGFRYENGVVVAESWADGTDTPTPGRSGCTTTALERDAQHRLVRQQCLDREGALVEDLWGCASRRLVWSDGRLAIRCMGVDDAPAVSSNGTHELRIALDAAGLPVDVRTFRTDGTPAQPMINVDEREFGHGFTGQVAGPARLVLKREPGPRISGVRWFDGQDAPLQSPAGWTGWDATRDPLGRVIRWTLLGPDETPIVGDVGAAIFQIDRTEDGQVERVFFFGAEGEPVINAWGYHEDRNQFEKSRMASWTMHGLDGEPVSGTRGSFRIEVERDAVGRMARLSRFGLDGAPITAEDGLYSTEVFERDATGMIAAIQFLDVAGASVAGPNGCARRTTIWAPDRSHADFRCFDEEGRPTPARDLAGAAHAVVRYRRGIQSGYETYDVDDKLMLREKTLFNARMHPVGTDRWDGNGVQVFRYRAEVDGAGRPVNQWVEDADGALVAGADGVARTRRSYDQRGNLIRLEVFGADDQPTVQTGTGTHRAVWAYDDANRPVETAFFGVRGEPVTHERIGAHRQLHTWNAMGKPVRIEHVPASGQSLGSGIVPVGLASYDARGNKIRDWSEDARGSPIDVARADVAGALLGEARFEYDDRGLLQKGERRLADGSPALCPAGFAEIQYTRTDGRLQLRFTVDDRPVLLHEGATWKLAGPDASPAEVPRGPGLVLEGLHGMAGWDIGMDARGGLTDLQFLGLDGAPSPVDGVAGARQTWNQAHQPVRLDWLDAGGQPAVFSQRGSAAVTWQWDVHGRLLHTSWRDADDQLQDGPDGYATWTVVRDGMGNPIEERFVHADGSPATNADGCHRITRTFRWQQQLTEQCDVS